MRGYLFGTGAALLVVFYLIGAGSGGRGLVNGNHLDTWTTGAVAFVDAASAHPTVTGGAFAVWCVGFLSQLLRHLLPDAVRKDPQRLFTKKQRNDGARRCGGRCEHKAPFWFRCRGPAEHGDHVYPHSKGGATLPGNLQMLCRTHNLRKSAHVPSRLYMWRLGRRRRKYFPPGVDPRVVWKLGDPGPAKFPTSPR